MKNHNFSPDNRPTRMINLVEDAMQMRLISFAARVHKATRAPFPRRPKLRADDPFSIVFDVASSLGSHASISRGAQSINSG